MNKEIQVFNNKQFGNIRMVEIDDKPYFVATDIAKALGYSNVSDAVKKHCRWVAKCDIPHPQSKTKTLEVNVIPEGDMYRLITNSELPSAENFESWVFDEVLPTIRKHGAYMTENTLEKALTNPDFLIQLATNLKEEQEKRKLLEEEKKANAPKVIFADAVATSKTCILIGELAKLLKQNGVDTGQKRLFQWLRDNGYLIKRKGIDYNMPTQKAMDQELFEIKETPIVHSDGHISISKTTKVTGKGQQYFINKFLN